VWWLSGTLRTTGSRARLCRLSLPIGLESPCRLRASHGRRSRASRSRVLRLLLRVLRLLVLFRVRLRARAVGDRRLGRAARTTLRPAVTPTPTQPLHAASPPLRAQAPAHPARARPPLLPAPHPPAPPPPPCAPSPRHRASTSQLARYGTSARTAAPSSTCR
jgi:hypothetical protein